MCSSFRRQSVQSRIARAGPHELSVRYDVVEVSLIQGSPQRLVARPAPIHFRPGWPFFIVSSSAEISMLLPSGS